MLLPFYYILVSYMYLLLLLLYVTLYQFSPAPCFADDIAPSPLRWTTHVIHLITLSLNISSSLATFPFHSYLNNATYLMITQLLKLYNKSVRKKTFLCVEQFLLIMSFKRNKIKPLIFENNKIYKNVYLG